MTDVRHLYKLQFASGWTPGTLLVAALVFVLVVFLLYVRLKDQQGQRLIAALAILRALALVVLLLTVARFSFSAQKIRENPAFLVFALDTSKSMTLPAQPQSGSPSRIDTARQLMGDGTKGLLAQLKGRFRIEVDDFDISLRQDAAFDSPTANVARKATAQATGEGTDLSQCLGAISSKHPPKELAGIVLLTDGEDNKADARVLANLGAQAGAPVFPVGIGSVESQKQQTPDVAVSAVLANKAALAGSGVRAMATIRASGLANPVPVEVRLLAGSRTVAKRSVSVGGQRAVANVQFQFAAPGAGTHTYTVVANPVAGEQNLDNNRRSFTMSVVSPKMKVLYIEGRLRWDYKFLRRILQSDPNVQLNCIIRTAADKVYQQGSGASSVELGSLSAYDVVIIGDIEKNHFSSGQLAELRRFVADKGGSLVMLGGDKSFGAGGYAGTPLADALPVTLSGGGTVEGRFPLNITSRGRAHPILDSFNVGGLPPLDGCNRVGRPKPGATVLATGPNGMPVIIIQNYGSGKTMAITAEGFWRWHLNAQTGGQTAYTRFWGQALRWLYTPQVSKGEQGRVVELYPLRDTYAVSSEVSIQCAVYGGGESSKTSAAPSGRIMDSSGALHALTFHAISGSAGEFETNFTPKSTGVYTVSVSAPSVQETRQAKFTVKDREMMNTNLNEPLLRQLASKSGGRYFTLATASDLVKALPEKKVQEVTTTRHRLWNTPWFFLAYVALLSAEWFLRKRNQMA